MNLLNKLTIKNLKLNKKRTIVTIIGIILSVALITAVSTMYSSTVESIKRFEMYHYGNYHVAFYNVNKNDIYKIKNNKGVDKLYLTKNIGYALLNGSKNEYKPYVYVKAFTKESLNNLAVNLIEGRLPNNENEILISNHIKTNARVTLNVGDSITLNIGQRTNDDGEVLNQYNPYNKELNEKIINTKEKTYKIVGIMKRPSTSMENYDAPGYTLITYFDNNNTDLYVDVYAKLNKYGTKNYLSVIPNILQIDEKIFRKGYLSLNETKEEEEQYYNELSKSKYHYDINGYLLVLENNPLDDNSTGGLGKVVLIVCLIIVLASVYCIKNSFDISIVEKTKQYGMLRSIGATKKQIRKNVFYEGSILALISIPLGILCGLFASFLLVKISNLFLQGLMSEGLILEFSFSWYSILFAILLGIITIYSSSIKSAISASRITPINSIRNSSNIKNTKKKIKSSKIIKKLFGISGEISYKNYKRNKKKYRTTTISITVSVMIFISLSYFTSESFKSVEMEINTYDYNLELSLKDIDNKILDDITSLNNIEDYSIQKNSFAQIDNPIYTKEYMEYLKLVNINEPTSYIDIITLGEYQYKKYLDKLNIDYDKVKNKAILYNNTEKYVHVDNNKTNNLYINEYDYKNNDNIIILDNNKNKYEITIGKVTNQKPFGINKTVLIIEEDVFDSLFKDEELTMYFKSNNVGTLEDDIDELLNSENYSLYNIEEQSKMMNNLFTLIAIFLYGFILVISLIGLSNIFNVITTNMALRKQEFAILKSVGMSEIEFKSMIRLDSLLILIKSLFYGIIFGIALSYLIYYNMTRNAFLPFRIPILSIIICVIVVYLLITLLMKYSINKINKENTIETIRNENI